MKCGQCDDHDKVNFDEIECSEEVSVVLGLLEHETDDHKVNA